MDGWDGGERMNPSPSFKQQRMEWTDSSVAAAAVWVGETAAAAADGLMRLLGLGLADFDLCELFYVCSPSFRPFFHFVRSSFLSRSPIFSLLPFPKTPENPLKFLGPSNPQTFVLSFLTFSSD
jgi:hypothetical protein